MATIQWFPGHMAKARREVTEKMKFVDLVIELVDARLPLSSRNPMLDQIIQQKPRIILLNKADLADTKATQQWQAYFAHQGIASLAIEAQVGKGIPKIMSLAKEVLKEKRARDQARGLKERPIRAIIIGIPNVGKSTLMNRLVKKNIAKTGNQPGVTKGQQWLKVGQELELLDTPGILWPKFEDETIGKKLALTGAIKDQLIHMDDVALFGLNHFLNYNADGLAKTYNIDQEQQQLPSVELLLTITKFLGMKEDYDRASERIVRDIRSGKLGRFTLDRVEDVTKNES